MKLKFSTLVSVILFLGIAFIHFFGIASGWYNPLLHWFWPMIGAFTIAAILAILCGNISYGVIIGKKTIEAAKDQLNSNNSSDRELAAGYIWWNVCAVILFWVMLALQISEV